MRDKDRALCVCDHTRLWHDGHGCLMCDCKSHTTTPPPPAGRTTTGPARAGTEKTL